MQKLYKSECGFYSYALTIVYYAQSRNLRRCTLKRTIVALPGAGNCLEPWDEVGQELQKQGYQFVLIPLPGYKQAETVEELADRLHSILNAIQGPYVLVGVSLGALIALVYASDDWVGSISQLILISPPMARSWRQVTWPVRLFLKTWPLWQLLGRVKARFTPKDLRTSKGALEAIRTFDFHNLSWVMRYCIACLTFNYTEWMEKSHVPTLVITGESDFWCRYAGVEFVSEGLLGNQTHVVLSGGHVLTSFDSAGLAGHIVRFLDE